MRVGPELRTHPLPPADPSREAPLQGGAVGRVPQQLHVRLLQVVLRHVVLLQSHVSPALAPRPGQNHHVAAAARSLARDKLLYRPHISEKIPVTSILL